MVSSTSYFTKSAAGRRNSELEEICIATALNAFDCKHCLKHDMLTSLVALRLRNWITITPKIWAKGTSILFNASLLPSWSTCARTSSIPFWSCAWERWAQIRPAFSAIRRLFFSDCHHDFGLPSVVCAASVQLFCVLGQQSANWTEQEPKHV